MHLGWRSPWGGGESSLHGSRTKERDKRDLLKNPDMVIIPGEAIRPEATTKNESSLGTIRSGATNRLEQESDITGLGTPDGDEIKKFHKAPAGWGPFQELSENGKRGFSYRVLG